MKIEKGNYIILPKEAGNIGLDLLFELCHTPYSSRKEAKERVKELEEREGEKFIILKY